MTYNLLEVAHSQGLFEESRLRLMARDAVIIGVTIPLLIAMTWFVYKTRISTAMRATAQDRGQPR